MLFHSRPISSDKVPLVYFMFVYKKGGHIGNVVSIVPYYVSVILSTSLVEQIHDNGTVDLTRKNIRREGLEPPTAAVPMEGSRYTP